MHVVIGGYGRVGRFLAHELERQGHTVAVIDRDPHAFTEIDDIRGHKFNGQVFDRDTMEAAGIAEASAYLAVTSGDNSNIVSARVARETYGVKAVIARIYDPRRAELYRDLGIRTISAVEWAASRLLRMVTHPMLLSEYQFGEGEVELVEALAPESLDGAFVGEIERSGGIRIAAIVREHKALVPSSDTAIQAGDRLYASVRDTSVEELRRALGLE